MTFPVNMTVQIRYRICTIFYRFVGQAVLDTGARYKIGIVLISASITGQYRLSGTGQYRFIQTSDTETKLHISFGVSNQVHFAIKVKFVSNSNIIMMF